MGQNKKILHLTLEKSAFDVMVTGEKTIEYRKPTAWIKSRLYDKNDNKRTYDIIKFTNGYGSDKPYFIAEFLGFNDSWMDCTKEYSNGLKVEIKEGDYKIHLGKIIEKGNLKE